jgi:hypothetical protein
MLHHFRFLLPLLPMDEEGLSELHYYDSAVQLARTADREPTEKEYQRGMDAVNSILRMCVSIPVCLLKLQRTDRCTQFERVQAGDAGRVYAAERGVVSLKTRVLSDPESYHIRRHPHLFHHSALHHPVSDNQEYTHSGITLHRPPATST